MKLNQTYSSALFLLALVATFAPVVSAQHGKTKSDEMAGAVLFRDQGCVHCHGVGGVGARKGPALTGLPKDKEWTPEKMTRQILNGGQKMPPFSDALTDEQISELVAYLKARHRPEPPPAAAADPTGTN